MYVLPVVTASTSSQCSLREVGGRWNGPRASGISVHGDTHTHKTKVGNEVRLGWTVLIAGIFLHTTLRASRLPLLPPCSLS